jgi:hypothetical protein
MNGDFKKIEFIVGLSCIPSLPSMVEGFISEQLKGLNDIKCDMMQEFFITAFLVAKLLYNSLCLSISQSVSNAMGET